MNKNLKMRLNSGKSGAQLAAELKEEFPGINKQIISYIERSESTGAVYSQSCLAAVKRRTGYVEPQRSCPCRIQGRVKESLRDEFNAAREKMGHSTVDEAVVFAIRLYIEHAESHEREAAQCT